MFGGNSSLPYSVAVAPLTADSGSNNNGGWGDTGAWWIVLFVLFFAFGGWGGNGWGGNGGGGAAAQGALTREQACIDNNFQNLMRETAGISDAVNVGFANLNSTICNQQYDTARMLNSMEGNLQGSLNAMNIANMQNANAANVVALQNANALQSQLASCCCENRAGQLAIQNQIIQQTCELTNQANNNTRDIIDAQNSGTRAILDYLCQEKISDLQNENQALRLAASQERQNAYLIDQLRPTAVPAYITCSPYASAFGYPYSGYGNNGCGCGCGCSNGYGVA